MLLGYRKSGQPFLAGQTFSPNSTLHPRSTLTEDQRIDKLLASYSQKPHVRVLFIQPGLDGFTTDTTTFKRMNIQYPQIRFHLTTMVDPKAQRNVFPLNVFTERHGLMIAHHEFDRLEQAATAGPMETIPKDPSHGKRVKWLDIVDAQNRNGRIPKTKPEHGFQQHLVTCLTSASTLPTVRDKACESCGAQEPSGSWVRGATDLHAVRCSSHATVQPKQRVTECLVDECHVQVRDTSELCDVHKGEDEQAPLSPMPDGDQSAMSRSPMPPPESRQRLQQHDPRHQRTIHRVENRQGSNDLLHPRDREFSRAQLPVSSAREANPTIAEQPTSDTPAVRRARPRPRPRRTEKAKECNAEEGQEAPREFKIVRQHIASLYDETKLGDEGKHNAYEDDTEDDEYEMPDHPATYPRQLQFVPYTHDECAARCEVEGCKAQPKTGRQCFRHFQRTEHHCKKLGCYSLAVEGLEVCIEHSPYGPLPVCEADGCFVLPKFGKTCITHTEEPANKCKKLGCMSIAGRGLDVCEKHSPNGSEPLCEAEGCYVQPKSGTICGKHTSLQKRKMFRDEMRAKEKTK